MSINIIFPNQLFEKSLVFNNNYPTFLIEEYLFFNQYNFHKQKILFHRDSMMNYYDYLKNNGVNVKYINSFDKESDIRIFLKNISYKEINIYNPVDNWLEKRILSSCLKKNIKINIHENPLFLTKKSDLTPFFSPTKKKLFQTSFYKNQRIKFNILLNNENKPEGGKWTYDDLNRKKYPKNKKTPIIDYSFLKSTNYNDSIKYVSKYFSKNYGEINDSQLYPSDFETSKEWFNNFLKTRFNEFGIYEDAILINESVINHSILSPLLNSGLLDPKYIIEKSIKFYEKNNIPLNSIEGFIRQIFWRNYMMTIYMIENPIIKIKYEISIIYDKLWNYKTNMYPIDSMIKTYILPYAYSHHITRLMYFGNFFKLCLLKNDIIYRWFMEAFIDAYSWVMYGNVYGMILNKIKIMTKNYIASSNYIFKMSNFKNINNWKEIFDALYYNYINENYEELKSDYGLRYQLVYWKKKTNKQEIINIANNYIKKLKNI